MQWKMVVTTAIIFLLIAEGIYFYPSNANHLPSYFSWRDINGIDYTTPVKNQEPCPSCEAYALVAILETLVQYKVGYPFGCDLSEAHLFFCSGGTCKWGVDIKNAAQYLVDYGVPDEGCFPEMHRKCDLPCNLTLPDWQNRSVKIREWGWVENNNEAIKKALIEHGPLAACIYIWKDFYYYHGGIYRHRWGRLVGGHVITIVGYNDTGGYWICKNSWGRNWGENGWFRVAYDANIFIKHCYGGTGIMYLDGVYGNLMPDAPKVYIESPRRYHTYLLGREMPSLFGRVFIQNGIPRVIGELPVIINASNTVKVEFYIDGKLVGIDEEPPFQYYMDASFGKHELKVIAYASNENISWAGIDFFSLT